MTRRISCRFALTALAAVVTFVAMADTSEAFWFRRRAVNYNNGYNDGCGCSSCGCAAVTAAPACGCTTATGTYDQTYNNGIQQAPYAGEQQGYIQEGQQFQGAQAQQGTPYQARRETFRGGEIQSNQLPSVREQSGMQSERSGMQSERSQSSRSESSQQNQQNRSSNRSNDRSQPPPPPET